MTFRPLIAADAAAVTEIARASFPEAWSEQDFLYFLTHDHRVAVGCVREGGKLVAYFVGLLVQGDLDIISIATAPESRRQGISRRLLDEVLKAPAIERAFLEVRVSNSAAQGLYRAAGFLEMGIRKKYYGGKEDALQLRWVRS